ncbi:MAG: N-acetyltransferase [Chloroflexi bacterium]|nr:N-acetyltransferase [Chloroflexota bacterium]
METVERQGQRFLVGKAVRLRRATVSDVPSIQRLISTFAEQDLMLHRSLDELYTNIRDFFVIEEKGTLIACSALHILWADLAEVKSVAVREEDQGRGYGRTLVEACMKEVRTLGIPRVFALTLKLEFFAKLGFVRVPMSELPRKVYGECYRCPKFHRCDEIAVLWQAS